MSIEGHKRLHSALTSGLQGWLHCACTQLLQVVVKTSSCRQETQVGPWSAS